MEETKEIVEAPKWFVEKFRNSSLDFSRRHYGTGEPYRFVSYNDQYKAIDIRTPSGFTYDVALNRCGDAAACLDWIHQLHEKIWFNAEVEKEFIDILLRIIPIGYWAGKA